MRLKQIAVFAMIVLLTACSTIYPPASRFEGASKGYDRLLRWRELDKAALAYVPPELREKFQERVDAAKEVRIVDYRIKSVEFKGDGTEAEALVELDYYRTDSARVKTVEDRQSWQYDKDHGWRLRSLLPEFH